MRKHMNKQSYTKEFMTIQCFGICAECEHKQYELIRMTTGFDTLEDCMSEFSV